MSVAVVRQGFVSYSGGSWQETTTSALGYREDYHGVLMTRFEITPDAWMRELTLSFSIPPTGGKECWWDTTEPANGLSEPSDQSRRITLTADNELSITGIFPANETATIWVWGTRNVNRYDNVTASSATGKPAGLGHIDEGSAYGDYMAYIDEGEEWGEYLPYEDKGNEWSILS